MFREGYLYVFTNHFIVIYGVQKRVDGAFKEQGWCLFCVRNATDRVMFSVNLKEDEIFDYVRLLSDKRK